YTVDRFSALRGEWTELLHDSAADGPFLTWEWLHAWWTHLRGRRSLSLVAVRDRDQLIAVAPMAVSRIAPGWLSRAELLGTGCAGSDYLDVIVRRGREHDGLERIGRMLDAQKRTLRLRNLRPGSAAAGLPAHLSSRHWLINEAPSGGCPVIALSGHSFDSY